MSTSEIQVHVGALGGQPLLAAAENLRRVLDDMRRAMTVPYIHVTDPEPVRDPLAELRAIAAAEKAAALDWWDTHLDRLYAEIGLPRDPHLIRGES